MEFLQNQNQTVGSVQPEVTQWESTAAVNDAIIVLGVLTFALQLCLVLFFVLRCWRFDNKVQEALKQTDTKHKVLASIYPEIYKQAERQRCHSAAASSPAVSVTFQEYEPFTNSLFGRSIPWDLVQRWCNHIEPNVKNGYNNKHTALKRLTWKNVQTISTQIIYSSNVIVCEMFSKFQYCTKMLKRQHIWRENRSLTVLIRSHHYH